MNITSRIVTPPKSFELINKTPLLLGKVGQAFYTIENNADGALAAFA